MNIKKYNLGDYLIVEQSKEENKQVIQERIQTNWIVVTDFSGSMYYELPHMANYLVRKIIGEIPKGDKITLIYFSSKGDFGTIVDNFSITDDLDKFEISSKIKSSFKTRGLTGFEDPLSFSNNFVDSNYANSMLFLTDGYDNQSGVDKILNEVDNISNVLDNLTIVEFGDYCNHNLLEKMVDKASESVKSSLVYTKDLGVYESALDSYFNNEVFSTKKIEYTVPENVDYVSYNEFSAKVVDGKVKLPEDVNEFFYIIDNDNSSYVKDNVNINGLLSLVYLYSSKYDSKKVYRLLSEIGDVKLWDMYSNAIGSQKVNQFKAELLEHINGKELYIGGRSKDLVVDENAYCVLNLLEDLSSNKDNKFFTLDDRFEYKSIGGKKVQRSSIITDEEKEQITDLKSLQELSKKKYELKFEYNEEKGHPFTDLVFNETEGRANISLRAKFDGKVDLRPVSNKLENDNLKEVNTFRYKNYTIVKDGIVNVDKFVVTIADENLLQKLKDKKLVNKESILNEKAILSINTLPVVNLSMVKTPSFERLAKAGWEMSKKKAELKVLNHYRNTLFPKKAYYLLKRFSDDVVKNLKEIGINHNGFSPKYVTLSEDEDTFPILKLNYKVKGTRSMKNFTLPSMNALQKKLDDGKNLDTCEELMKNEKDFIENELSKIKNEEDKEKWLITRQTNLLTTKRQLEYGMANIKFAVLVGQSWFNDIETDTKDFKINEDVLVEITNDTITKRV